MKLKLLAAVALLTLGGGTPAGGAPTVDYLTVMPIGDSITRGHGDPYWQGYRFDLRKRLNDINLSPNFVGPWTDGGGDNNHAGTSGARIDQVSQMVPQLVADYQPEVVLLIIGTNDIAQDYDMPNAPARLGVLVDRLLAASPTVRVFIGGVPQWTDQSKVDSYNNGVATVAGSKGPRVSFVPTQIVGEDPTLELTVDGVHPSLCGYARMAYLLYYYMGRSELNTTGAAWPTRYYPYGTAPGPCALATAKRWRR